MGRLFLVELEGKVYSCKHCKAHLASRADIVSKDYNCCEGRAYLAEKVVNVTLGEPKEIIMVVTGLHTVSEVSCVGCCNVLGWKYISAFRDSEKFKEQKYYLKRYKMLGPSGNPYQLGDAPSDDDEGEHQDSV